MESLLESFPVSTISRLTSSSSVQPVLDSLLSSTSLYNDAQASRSLGRRSSFKVAPVSLPMAYVFSSSALCPRRSSDSAASLRPIIAMSSQSSKEGRRCGKEMATSELPNFPCSDVDISGSFSPLRNLTDNRRLL